MNYTTEELHAEIAKVDDAIRKANNLFKGSLRDEIIDALTDHREMLQKELDSQLR